MTLNMDISFILKVCMFSKKTQKLVARGWMEGGNWGGGRHQETFQSDENILYHDCDQVSIYQTHQTILLNGLNLLLNEVWLKHTSMNLTLKYICILNSESILLKCKAKIHET